MNLWIIRKNVFRLLGTAVIAFLIGGMAFSLSGLQQPQEMTARAN